MLRQTGILLACVAAGLGLGAAKWRGSAEQFHREARLSVILSHASQMEPGGVLVIGDSVAERARFSTLCGKPALNAGIAWSTSADWLPDARKVIKAARPSLVILSIGTNDGAQSAFAELAKETGAAFAIAPRGKESLASPIPLLPAPTSYLDDKHPDARGYSQWLAQIQGHCEKI